MVRSMAAHAAVADAAQRGTWRTALCILLLLGIGCGTYANTLRVPFLFDDKPHIVANTALQPPRAWRALLFTERPVVMLTLAANHAVGGLDVRGYHAVNIGLHIAGALLLFGFARHLIRTHGFGARAGARHADGLAFVAAALFLLHPIQTESVTYIVQRAEILAALAVLGGLWVRGRAGWMQRVALTPILSRGEREWQETRDSVAPAPLSS